MLQDADLNVLLNWFFFFKFLWLYIVKGLQTADHKFDSAWEFHIFENKKFSSKIACFCLFDLNNSNQTMYHQLIFC